MHADSTQSGSTPSALLRYFAGLADYHAWATRKLLDDNLAHLSDDEWQRDVGLFFGSVHGTVSHLLVTDEIWFARIAHGTSPRTALDAQPHAERGALCAALETAVGRWHGWIDSGALAPAHLEAGELAYTRQNGEAVRVALAPALGHVFNHATHHRGQLSAAVTVLGHAGPSLDWLYLQQQRQQARIPNDMAA